MFSGREDDEIGEYFISTAFPPVAHQQAVVDALSGTHSMTVPELEQALNLSRGRIAAILKVLEVDGAVERVGGRYLRTTAAWEPDVERIESVTARRREELAQMRAYVDHQGCLMRFLSDALDDTDAGDCGRCATEDPTFLARDVEPALVREAIGWLRRRPMEIEPRKMWPANAVPGLGGKVGHPCRPGLALALEGDGGWGRIVTDGLSAGRLSDEVLDAAADLARMRWAPTAADGWWVTAVPSLHAGPLLDHAAAAIADRLGLAYRSGVLVAGPDGRPQRSLANSVQQLRNVHATLTLGGEPAAGPVLLIDDLVASRWTLTWAGFLLQKAGAGPVHPLVLLQALAGTDD